MDNAPGHRLLVIYMQLKPALYPPGGDRELNRKSQQAETNAFALLWLHSTISDPPTTQV